MTKEEVLDFLWEHSNKTTERIFENHGAQQTTWGVKIEYLKVIQKKVKKDYKLSVELFDTGISEAMYLAGLIADESKMSKEEIQEWANKAYWYLLSEYTVSWIAAESRYGWELALEWINSDKENIASSGWTTLSHLLALTPDEKLDKELLKALLDKTADEMSKALNRVRYSMNGFVISAGSYVPSLTEYAKATAIKTGKVKVNMGKTACKVPDALSYIDKVILRGGAKKKKTVRC
jgi:3-methyladenine DNA glycosylase AlkD